MLESHGSYVHCTSLCSTLCDANTNICIIIPAHETFILIHPFDVKCYKQRIQCVFRLQSCRALIVVTVGFVYKICNLWRESLAYTASNVYTITVDACAIMFLWIKIAFCIAKNFHLIVGLTKIFWAEFLSNENFSLLKFWYSRYAQFMSSLAQPLISSWTSLLLQ